MDEPTGEIGIIKRLDYRRFDYGRGGGTEKTM